MPYRTPGNDDELDARLDDELAQLDETAVPRPADWRARRRSPSRLMFAAASVGGGMAMLSGQSVVAIAGAAAGGALVAALFVFVMQVGERRHAPKPDEEDD